MADKHRRLAEQVIVITGASSGIGLCTALLAAERGAAVVLVARSEETLHAIASRIEEDGGTAVAVGADVADPAQVAAAAREAVCRFGRIDTWVNNAGVSIYGRLAEVSVEDSRRLFDTNFWGVVNGSRAALPHLRASGGTLVNVGSEVSDAVVALQGMYSASKHAVKGYTDALRVEEEKVAESGIEVVLVQPAATNTPFPQNARNYMDREAKLPSPMIDPHKVAEAILDAAVKGGRDVTVGMMAKMNTTTAKLMPRLGDAMAAMQADRQQHDEATRNPAGALHQAGGGGRIYGEEPG